MAAETAAEPTTINQFRRMWGLGYERLIPVMPPEADVHPQSRIAARIAVGDDSRGKIPGVRGRDGLWRGLDLNAMEATESDLDAWHEMGASVGVKTGEGLIAIDIDTTDRAAARALYELAATHLGPAPVRFGKHPKVLLPYLVEEDEDLPYRGVRFSTETERSARVEMLTAGRQFVAQGTHPATNRPYAWPQGITPYKGLTTVTQQQIDDFFAAVAETTDGIVDVEGGRRHLVDQDRLQAKDASILKDALRHLPNHHDDFPSRYDYIAAGCAIKAAFGEANEAEGLDAFLDWCAKWRGPDGERNDPNIAAQDWARMKPPFEIGAQWIFDRAERLGNWQGAHQQFLQPIEGAEPNHDQSRKDRPRIQVLKRDEIATMKRPRFLVDRHIPENSLGFIFGPPGGGKSFMAIDMGLHLAYGLKAWHGDALAAQDQGWVVYLAREGSAGMRQRLKAWEQHHAEEIEGRTCRFALIRDNVNFLIPEDVGAVAQAIRDANLASVSMIVVDTVSRAIAGADENAQKDMTTFIAACEALQDAFQCCVVGVHHSAKGSGDMRGSSVFRGAGDFVLKIEKGKRDPSGGLYARLICDKQKDADDGWQEHYHLAKVDVLDNGEPASSLVPRRVEAKEVPGEAAAALKGPEVGLILARITSAWEAGEPLAKGPPAPARKQAAYILARDLGLSADAVKGTLDLLEQVGQIAVVRGRGPNGKRLSGYQVVDLSVTASLGSSVSTGGQEGDPFS